MKNFFFYIIIIVFFIATFFIIELKQTNIDLDNSNSEKRAVFLSYIELNKYVKNKDEKESKQNLIEILDNIYKNKFNMLIIHVRPFSDAIYNSTIFPISNNVKVNGKAPDYDILKFVITEAKKRKIEVHAWINPYRISSNTDISTIDKNSIAYKMYGDGNAKVVKNKGIFYNPGSKSVTDLIVSGVVELVKNYNIDGIHFDDYFYPDADIDLDTYQKYIEDGGTLSLDDYRYNNILNLIKEVNSQIKKVNKNILFGISPEGNIENDYKKHYLNISEILSKKDYIDYIMPQIYFGFENTTKPYIKTIKEWNELITDKRIKLIPALAFYKSGNTDKYAKDGKDEWINNKNIITRQVEEARKLSQYTGFSLFRYDSIFDDVNINDSNKEELNNLLKILNWIN